MKERVKFSDDIYVYWRAVILAFDSDPYRKLPDPVFDQHVNLSISPGLSAWDLHVVSNCAAGRKLSLNIRGKLFELFPIR